MDPIPTDEITPDLYAGPFHDLQRARGARFYDDGGDLWTASFGDVDTEYWAVRRGAALWDTSGLVKVHVTGAHTRLALDRLTTRRLANAEPGWVRYGLLLDDHGLMLDDVTVVVISPDEAYLLANYGDEEDLERLRARTDGMQVRFENVTRELPSIAVQGPRSFEVLDQLLDVDVASLRWFRCLTEPVTIGGVRGLLVRAGFTGELGYEFYLLDGSHGAERAWEAAEGAGARPIGIDAIEQVRIEAGLVIAEEDYFPGETDPLELGLDRFVDDDHDFVGQAALRERRGTTRRDFVTLRMPDGAPPSAGSAVSSQGDQVGVVRSAASTPRFGNLALAVVDSQHAIPGARLAVEGRDAVVHRTPVDDPQKLRPRSEPRHPTTAG